MAKRFPDDYTEKTSIADNDQYAVADSASSDALVPIKHSTIKSDIQDINALSAKTSIVDADELIINDSADSYAPKKITKANLSNGIFADVNALSAKTSIVDADELMINDSAASYTPKKITKANLSNGVLADINALSAKASIVDADELVINDSADSNNPKKVTMSTIKTNISDLLFFNGLFTGSGVYFDGSTALRIAAGTIDLDGSVTSFSNAAVVDLTSLTSAKWYAICFKESDGTTLNTLADTGWDNWTISGNKLNLMSIYDSDKNYCRDSRSGVWYRIVHVYYSDYPTTRGFTIRQKPKTAISVYKAGSQTISTASTTVIQFDTIVYDLLSEWNTVNYRMDTASLQGSKTVQVNTCVQWADINLDDGELMHLYLYVTGAVSKNLFQRAYSSSSVLSGEDYSMSGSVTAQLGAADIMDIRIRQTSGGNEAIDGGAAVCWLQIDEMGE